MIDEIYKNSFKEVYDILENTEEDLLSKIPNSFMNFIKNNMNVDYKTSINLNETIDKQHLLKETEAILSLIYRSYWATDEEKNECFFRKLPLTTIKQITLRMDGKDEDAIPYATYMTANSTKEISTLNDVKKRLGLETDEDSDSVTPTPTEAPDDSDNSNNSNTDNPDPTTAPSDNNGNSSNNNPSSDDPTNSTIQTAEKYIGMSIDDLAGAVGDSQSSEYDDDSATGTTGYYYYPDFTVSTSVDEEGNEIVTGVW